MPNGRPGRKEKNDRILVLAVDIDNDLYRKTKISGPLVGRVQNLSGASQLALADPLDTDGNTMFEAVKSYDELKASGYTVNVATITGSETEGYEADREIARQLDLVLAQYKTDSCIFVTDGASDNRVLPIISSRIKINSVNRVTVKQAENLENTYFVIFEKLKEPHYARIAFGIPGLFILLVTLSYLLGATWGLPLAFILLGIYLVMIGTGLWSTVVRSFEGFGLSIDKISFVLYVASIILLAVGVFISFSAYNYQIIHGNNYLYSLASGIENFFIVLPVALPIYLLGRLLDVRGTRYMFRTYKYLAYIGSTVIFWVFIYSFTAWIIGQIYFSQFLLFALVAVIAGTGMSVLSGLLRRRVLRSKKIKGKLVINELGALIGKIAGLDTRRGRIIVNTSFGNPVAYNVDRIVDISDKVVIK